MSKRRSPRWRISPLEHFQRFVQERLMPALRELGGPVGQPPQMYEVYNMVVTDAARAD
jgi:hypothetical protein